MMTKKSSLLGLLGLFFAVGGLIMFLSGVSYGVVAVLLDYLGISLDFLATLSILGLFLGGIFFAIGMKIFFENESSLLKLLLGGVGVGLMVAGVIIGIAGAITGVVALFSLLILWSLGATLIIYGFEVNALKPLNGLISSFKKLLGVKLR